MNTTPKENSLQAINPELSAQWHPTKNGDLQPSQVTFSSSKVVWWKCAQGHEWQASVSNRSRGTGCPFCKGKIPIPGETDLLTVNPHLAKQWHPTKNGRLQPSQVAFSSHKVVWWKCAQGHEWQASVNNRSKGSGCPYCAGKVPIPGETDLLTVNPNLAAQWHPTKNGDLHPLQVTAHSEKKIWWMCSKKHEWQATIKDRARGRSCPFCAGKISISGETDLLTVNPNLATQWHPTKNGNLQPSQVTAFSSKKAWWFCSKGHEWSARIADRSKGINCPFCAGNFPIPGETDFLTVNPHLAAQWHPTKNGSLLPSQVTVFSGKKVWWICSKGHEWQVAIRSRSNGSKCPFCLGRIPIPGETDLLSRNPRLANEWHPTKNGDLRPSQVTAFSTKRVWWMCDKGHEWEVAIINRGHGNNCPFCSGFLPIPGETDLFTRNPRLANEWHPTKNGDLRPSQVTAFSKKRAWWMCDKGHDWQAEIGSRSRGSNCPICYGNKAQNVHLV